MQHPIDRSRRRFVFRTSLGLLAAAGAPAWVHAMQMQSSGSIAPNRANPSFKPDVEIDLLAREGTVSILPGPPTRVMQYAAKLKTGPAGTLTELPGSYLGPLIRLRKGQKVRINFQNNLAEPTIAHWHGMHVPAEMDGHPMRVIGTGETYVYEFEVLNRAGLHIYHPHPHGILGKELYFGMAGGIVVNDEEEARLGLPSGEYEIPVVIQDRHFDAQNQLLYGATMHDRMMGFYGDRILVNGRPNFEIEVASRAYRLRFLNGSNARTYKLGWSDGTPMTVIGVDGGLLEKPETRPYLMLGAGERLDVWADFSGRPKGTELTLRSLPFRGVLPKMAERMMHGGMGGMGHGRMGGMDGGMMGGMGMMGAMALPVGSDYPIFKVRVTRETGDSPSLPTRLSNFRHYTLDDVANRNKPIPIGISEAPMAMLLNGRPYAYNDVQPYERVPLNTIQLLEIFHAHDGEGGHGGNGGASAGEERGEGGMAGHRMGGGMGMGGGMMGGGMMGGGMGHGRMGGMGGGMNHGGQGDGQGGGMGGMGMMGGGTMFSMAHPIHLHGQQFEVISRTIAGEEAESYATVKEGLVDSGLKDTVLVMPGEKVRIIKPFQDFRGLFMYHCHNIEHEDMGMMREFLVE